MSNEAVPRISKQVNNVSNCNMEENMLMVHLEFEFGNEEKPRPCLKIPVSFEAAIVALLITAAENCEHM